ncbi:MAG TPA: hypothetical protein VHE78_11630 [Gemmatimonadaceae bacterium]|nr:hypothetical protein [Gemmatimonadaceae bacterium]
MTRRQTGLLAPALVLLELLILAGCKRGQDRAAAGSTGGAQSAGSSAALAPAPPGTLFPTGVMFRGDRASLQHYLQYVDTVVGARVRVTYGPRTVVVDRDAAIRSLHSATWDGVTWRFDAAEPAMGLLQPGSVLLVWGLAIRRVTRIDRDGDEMVVRTEGAQLTDAVTDADISWDAPAHLRQGAMAMRVPRPEDSVRFRTAALPGPLRRPSPFRLATFPVEGGLVAAQPDDSTSDPPSRYQESFKIQINRFGVAMAYGAAAEDTLDFYAQFAYGEDAEEPVTAPGDVKVAEDYAKKFGEWLKKQQKAREEEAKQGKKKLQDIRDEGKATTGPGPGLRPPMPKTTEEQQKQKEEEEAQAEYEKKYGKPGRNSTSGKPSIPGMPSMPSTWRDAAATVWEGLKASSAIKVTTAGTVSGFRSRGDITVREGQLERAELANPDFHLSADIYWAARIDLAVFAGRTKLEVPVTFRAPLIIGGFPFILEVAVNALIQPALTGKLTVAKGSRHIDFQKSAVVTVTSGDVSGESGDPVADAKKDPKDGLTGIGVSGLVIALQVPRVLLAFGFIGTNAGGYFDVVVSSNSTYTGATGIKRCTHSKIVANFGVGVAATFLGAKIGDTKKVGPQKEWDWDDPPGMKCS